MMQKLSLRCSWLGENFFLRATLFFLFSGVFAPFSEAFSKKRFVANRPSVPYASIVMEADTGRVLHEASADTKVFPASLTKMMTLYLAFKALREGKISLDQPITVSTRAQRQEPSKLGLLKGDTLTVRQAILALVTKSANDAAVAFAEFMDGTEDQFAKRMTRQAHALGMQRTQFYNASGLPHKLQKTTARDMAILSKSLWRDFPAASQNYFKTTAFQFRGITHKNHNHLLGKVEGVDGMKTGYIAASGFNLAASVKRKGHRLIVVVMGGKNRFWRDAHTTELINTAFVAPQNLASLTGAVPRSRNQNQEIKLASLSAKTHLEGPHAIPSLISRALAAPLPVASENHLKKDHAGAGSNLSIAHLINRGQMARPLFEKKIRKDLKAFSHRKRKKH
ncbi:MAG: D-alanyl-D-alanine carboxypeptidase family protein [Alphaproteobacteria bacterium]